MRPGTTLLIAILTLMAPATATHVTVTVFGNAAEGQDIQQVQRAVSQATGLDVTVHVHNVLVSWSDTFSSVDYGTLARDIKESDIVVLDNMGPMPTPFVQTLSDLVLGKPMGTMAGFLGALFKQGKKAVVMVTGEDHDFILVRSNRIPKSNMQAALVNLSFLFRFTPTLEAPLEFLLWLAYPQVPTSALDISRVKVTFVAIYEPGRGWIYPEVSSERLNAEYHRWLLALEGKAKWNGPLWIQLQGGVSIPSWAMSLGDACKRFIENLRLPWKRLVVVLGYVDELYKGEKGFVEAVTDAIRSALDEAGWKDVGVVAILCDGAVVKPVDVLEALKRSGHDIACVVSLWAFTMDYPKIGAWALADVDAPVIKVVYPFWADYLDDLDRYLYMPIGTDQGNRMGAFFEWTYQVMGGPEREGAFWFKMCALKIPGEMKLLPLKYMLQDLGRLVVGYVELRYEPNDRKRIAFILYDYPPGRGSIGASYLDVFESLVRIFAAMAQQGYDLGPATPVFRRLAQLYRQNPERAVEIQLFLAQVLMQVSDLVLKNMGPWARGELKQMAELYEGGSAKAEFTFKYGDHTYHVQVIVEDGKVEVKGGPLGDFTFCTVSKDQLVPVSTLEEWFREDIEARIDYLIDLLKRYGGPDARRAEEFLRSWLEQVEKKFGPPNDNLNIMIVDHRYYVIPAVHFGNVLVGLQPIRGWSGNPDLVYHSPQLPPNWQYICFYEWLRHVFHANAIVHVGTHGTLEWLPGHQVGLMSEDWPHLLLPDVPHVYLYITSNPGEAMVAKYRSGPELLTHLPPPWDYFKDFGKYATLLRLVQSYEKMRYNTVKNEKVMKQLEEQIIEEAAKTGVIEDVVSMLGGDTHHPEEWALRHFDRFFDTLHEYLLNLASTEVAYGLHVYGEIPPEKTCVREAAELAFPSVAPILAYALGYIPDHDPETLTEWRKQHPAEFLELRDRVLRWEETLLEELKDHPDLLHELEEYADLRIREIKLGDYRLADRINSLWNRKIKEPLAELAEKVFREVFGRPPHMSQLDETRLMAEAAARLFVEYHRYVLSGTWELDDLLAALDGKYVPPGIVGEPMWYPTAVPTGVEGYFLDPYHIPTPEAWRLAVQLVDRELAMYYQKYHRWPDSVGIVLWGVQELCSGGLGVAEVLYYLGVKPVWDPDTGRVVGVELIPLQDLKVKIDGKWIRRPRIDVVVWAALHMEPVVNLLEMAYYLVSHLNEPPQWNHRRAHYLQVYRMLIREGYKPSEADILASTGFFAEPPGVFTNTGVSDTFEHAWTSVATEDLGVDVQGGKAYTEFQEHFQHDYRIALENRLAYLYAVGVKLMTVKIDGKTTVVALRTGKGREFVAVHDVNVFRYLMSTVDMVTHYIANTWGLLDCDDYYDWVGGMAAYVRMLTGKEPAVYIVNAVNPAQAYVTDLKQALWIAARTTILSPSWIQAMLAHGDYGWSRIEKRLEYLVSWGATLPSLRPLVSQALVQSARLILHYVQTHPPETTAGIAAAAALLAWYVEAARIGIVQTTEAQTLATTAQNIANALANAANGNPNNATANGANTTANNPTGNATNTPTNNAQGTQGKGTANTTAKILGQIAYAMLKMMAKVGPTTCHHTSPNPALVAEAVHLSLLAGYNLQEITQLVVKVAKWYGKLDGPTYQIKVIEYTVKVLQRYARTHPTQTHTIRQAIERLEKALSQGAGTPTQALKEALKALKKLQETLSRTTPTTPTNTLTNSPTTTNNTTNGKGGAATATTHGASPGLPTGKVTTGTTYISLTGTGKPLTTKGGTATPTNTHAGATSTGTTGNTRGTGANANNPNHGAKATARTTPSNTTASPTPRTVSMRRATNTPPSPSASAKEIWLWVAAMLTTTIITYTYLRRRTTPGHRPPRTSTTWSLPSPTP